MTTERRDAIIDRTLKVLTLISLILDIISLAKTVLSWRQKKLPE